MEELFIFLGLTHGFINDFKKEKELIEEINPEFVLFENLENKKLFNEKDYENIFKEKEISQVSDFKEFEDLIRLCFKKKIKMFGIDLENLGFGKELIKKINLQEELNKTEIKKLEKILISREEKQNKIIKSFRGKSNKSILVFVGTWHLRENSPTLKEIINSKIIYPSEKNGKMIFEPTLGEIVYSEKRLE